MQNAEFPSPRPEAVKKLLSSTFVPKGRVDLQSFRMRSLRLMVTYHGNKDMCLSELTAQCFNFQRLRPAFAEAATRRQV